MLVTDAWHPQVNGVVRTLSQMRDQLQGRGWEVLVLGPRGLTMSCPTYPEIRLTLNPTANIQPVLGELQPNYIHIATEGPLGWAMRAHCLRNNWPFTTSFHTRFPEYLKHRFGLPRRWTYRVLRHFHQPAQAILVPTPSVARDLRSIGLDQVRVWGRGVDTQLFSSDHPAQLPESWPRPFYLSVGRLAVEKNLEAFLRLDLPGTKIVVGDGPDAQSLKRKFLDVQFLGARFGAELAGIYTASDVFVFPSLTDTFGLVQLEALACGTPVAALPSAAALDVLTDLNVATMSWNLKEAINRSVSLSRSACRNFALTQSWSRCADLFAHALAPLPEVLDWEASPDVHSLMVHRWFYQPLRF